MGQGVVDKIIQRILHCNTTVMHIQFMHRIKKPAASSAATTVTCASSTALNTPAGNMVKMDNINSM